MALSPTCSHAWVKTHRRPLVLPLHRRRAPLAPRAQAVVDAEPPEEAADEGEADEEGDEAGVG